MRRKGIAYVLRSFVWLALAPALALSPACSRRVPPCPECACPPAGGASSPPVQSANPLTAEVPRPELTEALAAEMVELSLKCVGREYPNKPSDIPSSDRDILPPRKLHPVFFGCLDWHSSVHGHWTMVRVLERFPRISSASRIRAALSRSFSPDSLRAEAAYFESAEYRKLFERPYGWGWLLRLAAEVRSFDDPDARRWATALAPLEQSLAERVLDYLPRLARPVREGTHNSTAFALAHIRDYAIVAHNEGLVRAVDDSARRFYAMDRDCPIDYEPSGEDFASPCLAEADLMRRVLPSAEFGRWLGAFLAPLGHARAASLRTPPEVKDPKDPKLGHLIGLMFERAWTMDGIGMALDASDERRGALKALAARHEAEGLRLIGSSGYGGSHWLASFAVFALTDANRSSEASRSSR